MSRSMKRIRCKDVKKRLLHKKLTKKKDYDDKSNILILFHLNVFVSTNRFKNNFGMSFRSVSPEWYENMDWKTNLWTDRDQSRISWTWLLCSAYLLISDIYYKSCFQLRVKLVTGFTTLTVTRGRPPVHQRGLWEE